MGKEFELKYAATPEILADLAAEGGFTSISMETVYYDTPAGDLAQKCITLRCRRENGRSVCTVKTPGDQYGRGEWEWECGDIRQAIPELCKLGAPEALLSLTQKGLSAVCGARFTRLCKEITLPDARAELALDSGVLLGAGQEIPLCEVEIEHKSGSEAAVLAYAEALAARFSLQSEPRSKFQRASLLAKGG